MKIRSALALLVISLPCLAGCGTVSNLEGKHQTFWIGPSTCVPSAFGGVTNDCRMIAVAAGDGLGWATVPLFVADLPLSVVGDLVTLPRVASMRREWDEAEKTGVWPEWAKGYLQEGRAAENAQRKAEGK